MVTSVTVTNDVLEHVQIFELGISDCEPMYEDRHHDALVLMIGHYARYVERLARSHPYSELCTVL